MHKFPIMDAKFMRPNPHNLSVHELGNPYTFLFIGHGRTEKGLDILVDAWFSSFLRDARVRLIIAGNISSESHIFLKLSCLENVDIISHFVSDDHYFSLIEHANCLVLPYKL